MGFLLGKNNINQYKVFLKSQEQDTHTSEISEHKLFAEQIFGGANDGTDFLDEEGNLPGMELEDSSSTSENNEESKSEKSSNSQAVSLESDEFLRL